MSNYSPKIKIENDNFSQNIVTLIMIFIDVSGSMSGQKESGVQKGLQIIKEKLLGMEDTTSTRVAIIEFGSRIRYTDLKSIETFNTSYYCRGEMTRLYDAIVFGKDEILGLCEKYKDKYRLNVNVIVLSDGCDNDSNATKNHAKDAIKVLQNQVKAGTVFYAIEDPSEISYLTKKAQDLGFNVQTVENTERSIVELSNSLSRSLVRSSQSGIPIGYSQTELSGNMSISGIASEDYKNAMANMQYDDPFAAEFENA